MCIYDVLLSLEKYCIMSFVTLFLPSQDYTEGNKGRTEEGMGGGSGAHRSQPQRGLQAGL